MNTQTIIVVPCYNEEKRLDTEAFLAFVRATPKVCFLFMNDGSRDGTARIIDALADRAPGRIFSAHLPVNKGKAEAVRLGVLLAITHTPEYVGYFDADLATPLPAINELLFTIRARAADVVMAARVQLLGRRIERNPARHIAGRVFATAASLVLGLRVYDTQCGAKIFRVTDRLKDVFAEPFTVRWIFDVEILARLIKCSSVGEIPLSQRCVEYPLNEWSDKKGSKLRISDFVISVFDLIKIWLFLRFRHSAT